MNRKDAVIAGVGLVGAIAVVALIVVGGLLLGGVPFTGDAGGGESATPAASTPTATAATAGAASTDTPTGTVTDPLTVTETPGVSAGTGTPSPTPTPTATPSPTPTATPPPTATPTPTPTATPPPTATPAADRSVNRTLFEDLVGEEINEYRRENGFSELLFTGTTHEQLTEMTRNHSRDLRADGEAWNSPDDYNFGELYRSYDLYYRCQIFVGDGTETPDNGKFMAVQEVDVSSGTESELAAQVMDDWEDNPFHNHKFEWENAETLGVGVALDRENETAYVSMSVC
jgi:hypothetical protein